VQPSRYKATLNTPPPSWEGGISANVIWGGKYEKGKRNKAENGKEKGRNGMKKEEKGRKRENRK
jgi:hypothetical protein